MFLMYLLSVFTSEAVASDREEDKNFLSEFFNVLRKNKRKIDEKDLLKEKKDLEESIGDFEEINEDFLNINKEEDQESDKKFTLEPKFSNYKELLAESQEYSSESDYSEDSSEDKIKKLIENKGENFTIDNQLNYIDVIRVKLLTLKDNLKIIDLVIKKEVLKYHESEKKEDKEKILKEIKKIYANFYEIKEALESLNEDLDDMTNDDSYKSKL